MIEKALRYLVSLAEPKIVTEGGQKYSTGTLYPVFPKEPETLTVHTLTGLVDYINNCGGEIGDDPIAAQVGEAAEPIVHVDDYNLVSFRSSLLPDHGRRLLFIRAKAVEMVEDTRKLIACPVRDMVVQLGTWFAPNDGRKMVIRLIGNIVDANSAKTLDDGITQQVNVKQGISLQGVADMPNTVELLPWRTFPEIAPQPSKWLIRVDRGSSGGPVVSLYEVNREQWRAATIAAIGKYLREALGKQSIIIA